MILNILLGALLGAVCKPLSNPVSKRLLTVRKKEFLEKRSTFIIQLVISAGLGGGIGGVFGISLYSLFLLALLFAGNVISTTDIQHRLIPNDMVLVLFGIKAVFGILALLQIGDLPPWNPLLSLAGLGALGFIFFLPGLTGKKIGFGDIKLAMAIGFCAELMAGLAAVVLMGVLVLAYGFIQRRVSFVKFLRINFPMGPFLCGAQILALLVIKFLIPS